MSSHGHFHWNELLTADVERAKRFYQETIGWTLRVRCRWQDGAHLLGGEGRR